MLMTWVGLAVLAASLTVLFLSMRAVMDIGGSCGSGGPFEIARPCPRGVGWLIPVSIWVGVVALAVYAYGVAHLPGPHWALLAWPALFLSLGWNFWEYGLDSDAGSVATGWIVCGVVFVLMGGLPLLGLLSSPTARRGLMWAEGGGVAPSTAGPRTGSGPAPVAPRHGSTPPTPARSGTSGTSLTFGPTDDVGDLAEDLERLAELHRQGALTDHEFQRAKARRIAGGGAFS